MSTTPSTKPRTTTPSNCDVSHATRVQAARKTLRDIVETFRIDLDELADEAADTHPRTAARARATLNGLLNAYDALAGELGAAARTLTAAGYPPNG